MTGNEMDALDFPGADRLRAAGRVAPPSPDVVAAALAAVRSAAGGPREDAVEEVELEREPVAAVVPVRTWRRRLPVLVSAAAVVVVALGVAFQPWADSGGVQGSPATERTAVRERTGPAPYWKVRTMTWQPASETGKGPQKSYRTLWFGRNKALVQEDDGTVVETGDFSSETQQMAYDLPGKSLDWDDVGKLPTDPVALRSLLAGNDTGEFARDGLFDGIAELLARSPAEPPVRAALFKILTRIPGVRVTEGAKDSTGRAGTAVELDTAFDWRSRLVVDTRTFHMLETSNAARGSREWAGVRLRAGDVAERTTYLSTGPAWEVPKPSPLPDGPFGK
ncbi:hypothetical protein I5Q34_11665 [Streptomyces sp. AV19]|uniref:hypothetical protein n=1 Tax=Streptomyces sp. AV19 TaxID=2793068 RepID=UPI0018FEDCE8|nr:hypothetical protein [Streptomyces sp. AV19]MBH1934923.1 hypothetical protein [Streptomyces sp. AV19]MDG4534528.1 hypothetical protein [Streptomyces sp. AV19]